MIRPVEYGKLKIVTEEEKGSVTVDSWMGSRGGQTQRKYTQKAIKTDDYTMIKGVRGGGDGFGVC